MMGWGGYGGMMGGYGFGVLSTIFWLIILIDLILLGVWLWKQIQKK
ncbi:sporulation protein YjcZ [Candidatus Daviesbacteria bacterium]|nr:sporulation protein YjcZ [Candidatus Daviesbacteria bacterium]MBI4035425.1 sporulation protein YjcZ [Candidatus Daviesbacteria bacterium]